MAELTSADERKLFDAVKQANASVQQGDDPTTAVEKVARAMSLQPGQISLVAHAYNTGRQLDQQQRGGSILDKVASFPLARADEVIQRIHGAEKEAAEVSPSYLAPPDW